MQVFISRSNADIFELQQYCEFRLWPAPIAISLIETKSVPFTPPAQYDCIFFGSRRSVNHFLEGNEVLSSAVIACAGEATKNTFKSLGSRLISTQKQAETWKSQKMNS